MALAAGCSHATATIGLIGIRRWLRPYTYALKVKSCLIDGEITVCNEWGLPVFDLLRHGARIKPEAVLFAFDLLELDGEDLRPMPIEVRKRKLVRLVHNAGAGLQLSQHQPAPALGRSGNVRARLQAGLRGHCQQAAWLALRLWANR